MAVKRKLSFQVKLAPWQVVRWGEFLIHDLMKICQFPPCSLLASASYPLSLFWLTFLNKTSKIAGVGQFCFPITSPLSNPTPNLAALPTRFFPLPVTPAPSPLPTQFSSHCVFFISFLHLCSPCQALWITNYSSISSLAKVTGWKKKCINSPKDWHFFSHVKQICLIAGPL